MRLYAGFTRTAATLLLGLAATAAQGQCVSTLSNLTQVNEFPNRPPAHIAWTGSSYGVLRVEPQTRSNPIYFTLTDSDLNPRVADTLVADNTFNGPLAFFWTGGEFGVFYQDTSFRLFLQRVGANGGVVGAPIAILPNRSQLALAEYDFAWNAAVGAYAILHVIPMGSDQGMYLTTIRPDGAVLVDNVVSYLFVQESTATRRLAVTANGSMGVLWKRTDGYWFAFYAPTVDRVNPLPAAPAGTSPVLASNGTSFAAVFVVPGSGNPELHFMAFDAAGNPGPQKTILTASGSAILPISLLWNSVAGEYGLVYVDAPAGLGVFPTDTRLRRLSASGATVADTEFSPDTLKSDYNTRYPVIFNGSSFVGEIDRTDSSAQGEESFLVRHCPLRVTISADQGANVPPSTNVTFRANTSGGFGGFSYFWDFGDLNQTTGNSTITHAYTRLGSYTVSVTVKDAQKTVQTATFPILVTRPKARAAKH
jgi:PKD domain